MAGEAGGGPPRRGRTIAVEVAYARPERQVLLRLRLPSGATVRDAIETSGILRAYPELRPGREPVGIYGRIVDLDDEVRGGDRIEIYRPLRLDPKVRRRRKADAAGG